MRGWVGSIAGMVMLAGVGIGAGVYHYGSDDGPVVVTPATGTRDTVAPRAMNTTTSTTSSTTTTTTVPEEEAVELPSCDSEDVLVENDPEEDWATTVVDPSRGIDPDFRPSDLENFNPSATPGEIVIREIVIDDLAALVDAAADNDTPLTLVSGFRSADRQETLLEEGHEELGENAHETIARPGHSEHQLGTAVDVLQPGLADLSPEFGATETGRWLEEHAHEYGFVVSYPDGGEDTSCYSYEPWHLRYVGRDIAGQIVESGMTPREWLLTTTAE